MPISDRPWGDVSEADYADVGAFCDASLINMNMGPRSEWTKDMCKLRVREPGGALNRNGVHAAAAALAGARTPMRAPAAERRAAARKLIRHYGEMDEEPPESLRRLAGM